MFDGVHLGHQEVLKKSAIAITFSNHPQSILSSKEPFLLTSLSHRLHLLELCGLDSAVTLPFTKELSLMSAEAFILMIRQSIPFKKLILGHDATFGHKRDGTAPHMLQLGEKYQFSVEYLKPIYCDKDIISSSRIRIDLEKGNILNVSNLLGRPYSILSSIEQGAGKGAVIGFRTANISLKGLCLPPFGVYAIEARVGKIRYTGIANLGLAPTLHNRKDPILEVHLFDLTENLYGAEIEVFFNHYIRSEREFSSVDELKSQIKADIQKAEKILP